VAEPTTAAAVLEARFPILAGRVSAPRPRRVFADVPSETFGEVLDAAIELGFDRLVTISGLDEGESLAALYSLAGPGGVLLNLRVRVPRQRPALQTVSKRFPGGAVYERELVDLLGFEVVGLPPGHRYPLPEDWPHDQKPLRKDWKPGPGRRSR
jgi:membrane-bound hydrogenase subunit beta